MDKLTQTLTKYNDSLEKVYPIIPGEIGISLNGNRVTEVPGRGQFVYVRLRSNTSEIIQAFNGKVFPGYGIPVLVRWNINRYEIFGLDSQRYQQWLSDNPHIAKHGATHSMDKEGGKLGTDPVWVYPYQFIPGLVTPFAQSGIQNVFIHPSFVNFRGDWKYLGNTGTASLVGYRNTTGSVLVLVTLDGETGNPALFATTGTYIPTSTTGTVQLSSYIPEVDLYRYLPLSFVKLLPTTQGVGWNEVYDVRQLYGALHGFTGSAGGSGMSSLLVQDEGSPLGGGTTLNVVGGNVDASISGSVIRLFVTGSVPTLPADRVVVTDGVGGLSTDDAYKWDDTYKMVTQGMANIPSGYEIPFAHNQITTGSAGRFQWVFSDTLTDSGYDTVVRAGGTPEFPTKVLDGMVLRRLRGWGCYASGSFTSTRAEIRYVADGDWSPTETATKLEIWTTPTGTATLTKALTIGGDGNLYLEANKEYRVNGVQHTHAAADITSGTMATARLGSGTADATTILRGDNTWINRPKAETNANDIFRVNSPGGNSAFAGTINGTPSGTSVTYNVTSGNEGAMVPASTGQLAKMRLYNTTRGDYALIANCNTGTNVITLTADAPASWANTDVITIASQTVVGGGLPWVDLEITSGITDKESLFLSCIFSSATVGHEFYLHPFETYSSSKATQDQVDVSSIPKRTMRLYPVISYIITSGWSGTPTVFVLREAGFLS